MLFRSSQIPAPPAVRPRSVAVPVPVTETVGRASEIQRLTELLGECQNESIAASLFALQCLLPALAINQGAMQLDAGQRWQTGVL